MKPMLARTYGPKFDRYPCFVQPKLNGVRALTQGGVFQSRDEKIWNPEILRHLEAELKQVKDLADANILDGELYVHGWRLQRINSAIAVKRKEPTEDTGKVEFHVFDVVDPTKPFSERFLPIFEKLTEANLPHVKAVDTLIVGHPDYLSSTFHYYVGLGYEGIMLRPDGPYEFGETDHGTEKRSYNLWKKKDWKDGEWRCVGWVRGEGKADIGVGALILTVDDIVDTNGVYSNTFNVGTGYSDEERVELAENPPLNKFVKIRYPYLSEDGVPQCPSFLCVLD